MARYFYTEIIRKIPSLGDSKMNHMDSSRWLQKSEPRNVQETKLTKFISLSIKNGLLVNQLETSGGFMTIRYLWKESAWLVYCELSEEDRLEAYKKSKKLPSEIKEGTVSWTYKEVDEDEKNELIKKYFMDYFID